MFKKFFNSNVLNNENGSVLAVVFAVMAVLTLSLTAVTVMTVNTAKVTSFEVRKINSHNTGEGLINEAIEMLRDDITITQEFPTELQLNNIYVGSGLDAGTLDTYTVRVNDVTADHADEGYGDFGDLKIHLFRFDFTLETGNLLVRYLHITTGSSSVESFNPFDYAMGTNGDLILGGGYYNDVKLFGRNVYMSTTAPYYNDFLNNQSKTDVFNSEQPYFTNPGSTLSTNNDLLFCPDDSCYGTSANQNSDITFYRSNFDELVTELANPVENDSTTVNDFFGEWTFEEYVINYVANIGPTNNLNNITEAMTLDTLGSIVGKPENAGVPILNASGKKVQTLPDTAYVNLTDYEQIIYSSPKFSIYFGDDLTIDDRVRIRLQGQFNEESALIVDGNLTIDMASSNSITANIVVTGNVIVTGKSVDVEGMLIVLGQTFFRFDDGQGFTTTGRNEGYTFLTRDNIIIESIYAQHTGPLLDNEFSMFIYTEESIYVDGVNSNFHLDGSMFARAANATGNYIPVVDFDTGEPILGIFISSYQGYISSYPSSYGQEIPHAGIINLLSNGFTISVDTAISYDAKFVFVPEWESLVYSTGTVSFFPGEFAIE